MPWSWFPPGSRSLADYNILLRWPEENIDWKQCSKRNVNVYLPWPRTPSICNNHALSVWLNFFYIYIGYCHQCYDRTSEDNSSPTRLPTREQSCCPTLLWLSVRYVRASHLYPITPQAASSEAGSFNIVRLSLRCQGLSCSSVSGMYLYLWELHTCVKCWPPSRLMFNMSMVLLHLENAAIFLIRIKLTDKYN